MGQVLSSALEFKEYEETQKVNENFKSNVKSLSKYLQNSDNITDALTGETVNLLNVVNATGAVIMYEKKMVKLGITPDEEKLEKLNIWIKENINDNIYYTVSISEVYKEALAYSDIASGMLVAVLSKETNEYIIWFTPEFKHTINWAGNPEKPTLIDSNGLTHLTPRNSFALWSQIVSGKSQSWNMQEIKSVIDLKEEILYSINLKAGALLLLNEKLRKAYDELDTFSFTVSHDLKNPIAAIKGYAQLLTLDETIGISGQLILLRIAERAAKMNFMINEILDYSKIGSIEIQYKQINAALLIQDIIKELSEVYDTSNLKITIGDTHYLNGDELMIYQVFSNLLGNAIKYSLNNNKIAMVHIEGHANEKEVRYTIRDNGIGIDKKNLDGIFKLFKRMDNVKDIEGSGVGLAIVKRIVEKHKGHIWAESELNKGSSFFVVFNK